MSDDRPRFVTALAATLKAARESKHWSQRRLADEVVGSGHEISSAYVGLIEAGHRIPTEAVVRALAGVLGSDADAWVRLRGEAESDKQLVKLAQHLYPAAFDGVARALTQVRATLNTPLRDIDPAMLAEGSRRVREVLERHGDTPTNALKQQGSASVANRELAARATAAAAAQGVAAWLSESGGPRRGRRYELATKLFELVADLDGDELQRVIGYVEAVKESRRAAR